MKNNGWVKIHRKLRDNPIYSNSTAVHCWIECLLRANHENEGFFLSRRKVILKPGEFVMGREEFGEKIGVSGSTAWYWLNRFKADSMIDIKTTNKGSVISIKKWNTYQKVDSKIDNRKTTDEQQMNTDKNEKNNKKINKKNSNNQKIWDSLSKQDKWLVEKGHLVIKNGKLLSVDLGDI